MMKKKFELADNTAYPGIKGVIHIIGEQPENKPYMAITFANNKGDIVHGWVEDKDLERLAVNILKAMKSKRLTP